LEGYSEESDEADAWVSSGFLWLVAVSAGKGHFTRSATDVHHLPRIVAVLSYFDLKKPICPI